MPTLMTYAHYRGWPTELELTPHCGTAQATYLRGLVPVQLTNRACFEAHVHAGHSCRSMTVSIITLPVSTPLTGSNRHLLDFTEPRVLMSSNLTINPRDTKYEPFCCRTQPPVFNCILLRLKGHFAFPLHQTQ